MFIHDTKISHLRPHVAVFYVFFSHYPNSKFKSDLLIPRACEFACSISIWNQHDTVPLSINISSPLIYLLNSPLPLAPHTNVWQRKNTKLKIGVRYNIIYLFTAIGLLPGGSGYFTCIQNMKLVTNKFKSGGLHEKHVVATWNVGNRLSVCL